MQKTPFEGSGKPGQINMNWLDYGSEESTMYIDLFIN